MLRPCVLLLVVCSVATAVAQPTGHPVPSGPLWLTYEGSDGLGAGKHIVLIAADQEYRSEQALPMLAGILSKRHGFHCTVLFLVNDKKESDPTLPIRWQKEGKGIVHEIPGLEEAWRRDSVELTIHHLGPTAEGICVFPLSLDPMVFSQVET